MKFTISTQELNFLINKIQNIVPLKPSVPILANFLIEAYNDELVFSAIELSVSIQCTAEIAISEEGSTTLPAKRFAQLVRELTTPNVEISTNSQQITTLVAGTSRFKLNGMSKESYPEMPDLSQAHTIEISQKELKDLLYRTSFAVSKEDNRYALTGVLLQIGDSRATFVGTDGKRLARSSALINVPNTFTTHSIIPLKAVDEMVKNLKDEGEAKIFLLPDKIGLHANQTLLIAKLLSGDFPDVQRVIPEHSPINVSLHRDELITLLRQVSLFTADQNHSVRFAFTPGELKLTANTSEIGEGQVAMPANFSGEKLEAAFNPGFFLDILRHCKEDTVTLGLEDANNPGVITDGESTKPLNETSPLFVIMPMRLSEDNCVR